MNTSNRVKNLSQTRGKCFFDGHVVPRAKDNSLVTFSAPGIATYNTQNIKRRWSSGSVDFARRIRIPKLPRESAAIVILRKKGQPIQNIAEFLGRSTSYVHRILKFNNVFRLVKFADLRKLPTAIKQFGARFLKKTMLKLAPGWLAFILGETDKPP